MKRNIIVTMVCLAVVAVAAAQERKVQHRPYTDLRQFHFGIHVGAHMQDIELTNVGLLSYVDEDGVTRESYVTCDQDRMDPGFNVGVLGELRLSEHFQLRFAPAIYFGSRHFVFRDYTENPEKEELRRQSLKSALITATVDLIFAAPRCNNHRAYMLAGVTPAVNLTGNSADYLRMKRFQAFLEVGFGIDEYLPYFKCRPELKFMFGLGNALDMKHADGLRDKTMTRFAKSVSSGHTKMITLTFYFE